MFKDYEQECAIDGVLFQRAPKLMDHRGMFRKVFSMSLDIEKTSDRDIKEVFYTESKVGVIRGMHVQVGVAANYRNIFVVSGRIYDVIIDLRPKSSSYGKKFGFLFDEQSEFVLCLPPGVAHGFQSLSAMATVGYATTSAWHPALDTGINPLSIDVSWPLDNKLLSQRDLGLPNFPSWEQHLKEMGTNSES
jgi:dTDP-4-dehydrorhamnose 3,5-epimerase